MARKPKGATPRIIKTTAAQLQDAIRDAAGASQRAANANSNKSTALSDYCAKSGLPAKSVKLILDCHKMEDVKRKDFVLGFLMAHQMMGWGEQSDLFDDVGKMIADAATAAEADERSRKGQAQGSPGLPLEEPVTPEMIRYQQVHLASEHFRGHWSDAWPNHCRPGHPDCTTPDEVIEDAKIAVQMESLPNPNIAREMGFAPDRFSRFQ